jgi:hypothetical protein
VNFRDRNGLLRSKDEEGSDGDALDDGVLDCLLSTPFFWSFEQSVGYCAGGASVASGGIGQMGNGGAGIDAAALRALAAANARSALEAFSSAQFSGNCTQFIYASLGEEIQTIQGLAASAQVQDMSSTMTPAGVTLFPNNPSLAAAEQARDDAATGIRGTTIDQLYLSMPGSLIALGQYMGNTIFYNPLLFSNMGNATAMFTMFHETLHLAGFSDAQLETDFGISPALVAERGSQSITDALIINCGNH